MQPLVDEVAKRLPVWKGRMLNKSGRLILTKMTLSIILVHISMAIEIAPGAIKAIDTHRRFSQVRDRGNLGRQVRGCLDQCLLLQGVGAW